ncbi:PPK2 family polyphosphate:nucleotide phosphotransferase [Labedaea rhizosphaerae]|uniref:PPK2 family polyphosphate:nucleotide phosphotransferase n=2 Tax=Labedaea rhizosphaerae TaxID=598644 RepID=A0A4R6SGF2_LABRH|nr:PPK2 family polyphosphate:nucleotide phosphotransferase [Labedaea rhizosphaerae]
MSYLAVDRCTGRVRVIPITLRIMAAAKVRDELRVRPGDRGCLSAKPRKIPIGPKSKSAAKADLVEVGKRLATLQEALFAQGVGGRDPRRVLLVLQGMDTSGKGGTIGHVCGLVDPQGLHIASFKKPTEEESTHDFLWRIRKQVPGPGMIGVFDRSHYEDVLIARVESLVSEEQWRSRYAVINTFEAELAAEGVALVKCMLHISREKQRERLLRRLTTPEKQWKYNPADLRARAKWDDYQAAYTDALASCSTDVAPWYVVPADRKWYRNWAIAHLLLETLEEMAPRPPKPDYDVKAEIAALKAST